MNEFRSAQKQFEENVRLFGHPQTNPEKYNLYNGLANLAKGLGNLQISVDALTDALRRYGR